MNHLYKSILKFVFPLAMVTLACSLFSTTKETSSLQDDSQSASIQQSNTPKPSITSSPVPLTATQPLATVTPLPPTPTVTPIPPGIEIIPAAETENTSSSQDTMPGIDIKSEVFFTGDAGGAGSWGCTLPDDWSLPTIADGGWGYYDFRDNRNLCLLGFQIKDEIRFSLYSPDGKLVGNKIFVRNENFLDEKVDSEEIRGSSFYIFSQFEILTDEDGHYFANWNDEYNDIDPIDQDAIIFSLWYPPVGYPEGTWKIVLEYDDNQTYEYQFDVEGNPYNYDPYSSQPQTLKKRSINILENPYFNPLDQPDFLYYPGDKIFFVGSGYTPNSEIPIGVYALVNNVNQGGGYKLVFSRLVNSDDQGSFWFAYQFTEQDLPGQYFIIDNLDPDIELYYKTHERKFYVDEPVETPTPTPNTPSDSQPTATEKPTGNTGSAPKSVFNWISEVAFKSQSSGYFANLKIDSQDDLHLGFFQDTNDIVWWIEGQNNQWVTQEQVTGGSGMGFHVSMTLDSKDHPHFAYHSIDTKKQEPLLYYKYWKGNAWMGVFKNAEYRVVNTGLSIALGPDDKPHFVFVEDYGYNLIYSQFGGSGFVNQVVGQANPNVQTLSLEVDESGRPHIAYQAADQGLLYVTQIDENWVWEVIDNRNSAGQYSDIAIDTDGNVHIAYYDQGETNLKYASRSNDGWEIQIVDSTGNVGQYPSIAVDALGNIHISYYDVGNTALKYAYGTEGSWAIETVDNQGSVGEYTSIDLNSKDIPYIVYFDGENKDLKLARAMPLSP